MIQTRQQALEQQQQAEQERHDEPLDKPQKSYRTILEQQASEAEEELQRPVGALLLSGLTAGLDLGFGPFAMVVFTTLTASILPHELRSLLAVNFYSAGFVFVTLGRSALFTEHTTLAVQPVLLGRATIGRLLRLWGLVLVSNLVGCALFAWFGGSLGIRMGVVEASVIGEMSHRMIATPSGVMVMSAIAAGWLMGLLSWLSVAGRDTMSQIVVVWLTTFIIGMTGLHHSIAGTVEVLMGVFIGQGATIADYGRFIVLAVVGNAIGGTVFVAMLKTGHVKQS